MKRLILVMRLVKKEEEEEIHPPVTIITSYRRFPTLMVVGSKYGVLPNK